MSDLITPTTELEAVNVILAAVGESPVVSLDGDFVDAELARNILKQTLRGVLAEGYTFNTEYGYTITPDNDGYINLPLNTLKVIKTGSPNYVQRGTKLYNNTEHTNVFTEAQQVDLVVALPFEDLPEPMRLYLTIRAARRFQDQQAADGGLHQFSKQDEMLAKADMMNHEAATGQYNVVTNSTTVQRIKGQPR